MVQRLVTLVPFTGRTCFAGLFDVEGGAFSGGDLSVRIYTAPWLFSDEAVHLFPNPVLQKPNRST